MCIYNAHENIKQDHIYFIFTYIISYLQVSSHPVWFIWMLWTGIKHFHNIFIIITIFFMSLSLYCRFLMKDLWLWWSHWLCCREWWESPLDWSFPLLSMTSSRPIRRLLESSTPTSSLAVHCLISQMIKKKWDRIRLSCGLFYLLLFIFKLPLNLTLLYWRSPLC